MYYYCFTWLPYINLSLNRWLINAISDTSEVQQCVGVFQTTVWVAVNLHHLSPQCKVGDCRTVAVCE